MSFKTITICLFVIFPSLLQAFILPIPIPFGGTRITGDAPPEEEPQPRARGGRGPIEAPQQYRGSGGEGTLGRLLASKVKAIGAKSANGQLDLSICGVTNPYAQNLADKGYLDSHAGFSSRRKQVRGSAWNEIIAYSTKKDPNAAAEQCVQEWLRSPSHNAQMQKPQRRYCYSMSAGPNGHFCVGFFAN